MNIEAFELPIDVLRARQNVKWIKYAPDVLPAWVAEMDFSVAHPIRRTIEHLVADGDYGYPQREGGHGDEALARAFADRMQSRFAWTIDPADVLALSDLVQGTFAAIWAFSDPGDGVILQLPAYPPFHMAINETGRRLIPHHVRSTGQSHAFDLTELPGLCDATTRMLLLCNPQNPTGHVFTREALLAIGALAIERNLIIVSDEIHADLLYSGATHIPIASLSPEIAARTVTITSATKGFNIPGLRCGVMHFGTAELRKRFHARIPHRMMGSPSIIGIDATVVAWRNGQPWLDEVLRHLHAMRDRLKTALAEKLPEIHFHAPEATYLGWLDCTKLKLATSAFDFFHDNARVAFSPGQAFVPGGEQCVRFNFATSTRILDQIVDRMADGVRRTNAPRH